MNSELEAAYSAGYIAGVRDERAKHNWTKIVPGDDSTLPEIGKHVFIYRPDMMVKRITGYLEDNGEYYSIDGDPLDKRKVTHWQPLPEPPKE